MEVEEKWQNINAVSAVIFMTKKKRGSRWQAENVRCAVWKWY
jgi:hypothetical protein